MINWIVWNRTIYIKMDLALNNLQKLICHKTPNNKPTYFMCVYICVHVHMEAHIYVRYLCVFMCVWVGYMSLCWCTYELCGSVYACVCEYGVYVLIYVGGVSVCIGTCMGECIQQKIKNKQKMGLYFHLGV